MSLPKSLPLLEKLRWLDLVDDSTVVQLKQLYDDSKSKMDEMFILLEHITHTITLQSLIIIAKYSIYKSIFSSKFQNRSCIHGTSV